MYFRLAFIGFVLLFLACSKQEPVDHSNFRELTIDDHGIDFTNDLTFSPELNIVEYLYFNNGGGVAIGDIDNDGLEDIFLTANQKENKLYKNLGSLKFKDISQEAGIAASTDWSTGAIIDDINNDGFNDIYVCQSSPVSGSGVHNLLYLNKRDGTFQESSAELGLDFSGFSTQSSFFDYDRDGDLDMYLLNHSVHSTNSYGSIDKRTIMDELSGDRLFENRINEDGAFVDVTESSGIYSSALGYGLGVITTDLNQDGWVDIYVGNDFHDNDYLYFNNGDGTFTESIESVMTQCSQFTMGVDAADIDGDGLIDVFTTDMMPYDSKIMLKSGGNDTEQITKIKKDFGYLMQYARNTMQIQNPGGYFQEQGLITKTFASDWSWSTLIQDFDNSGTADIFISNGILNRPNDLDYIQYINTPENRQKENESDGSFNERLINQMPNLKIPNLLFYQSEDLAFTKVKEAEVGSPNYASGAAYADLDNDGDLDLISVITNGPVQLLENISDQAGHFISFSLKGRKNSKIQVFTPNRTFQKEYTTTRGFQSSSTHKVHFGLGDIESIDSVYIHWPDGSIERITDLVVDQSYDLGPGDGTQINNKADLGRSNIDISVLQVRHVENEYDDLDHEPLMPYKLSQEGPAALLYDFNKDGIKDLFIGGAKNERINYFLGSNNGAFQKVNIIDFNKDSKYEDVDAAILDFNGDGFKDIYVVSGGNEHNELDKNLEDRLYINDGQAGFFRLQISLPHTNGSCISVSDFDNDGYDDFFVGSRNVPGAYGMDPVSFIIKNIQGQRLEIAGRLRHGMITDAIWEDFNEDGNEDLLITSEWGALKLLSFENDSSFVDITAQSGIPDVKGMFQTVEVADVNDDGKPDIFLGNIGHNTTWQLEEGNELSLFLADFDDNSFVDPVIFNNHFEDKIPFPDKMSLKTQIPSVNKVFQSFEDYASFTSIDQISSNKNNQEVTEKSINTLSSLVLLSGHENYQMVNLPRALQLSTVNDFYWVNDGELANSLIYVANDRSHSHWLGKSLSSTGGILTNFDPGEGRFMSHRDLNLPIGTVSRSIIPVNDTSFLIINNNGDQNIVDFSNE